MPYEVRVTGPAKDDIARNYRWWSQHRSREQAARWFNAVDSFLPTLAQTADRYPLATERALREAGVRQALFGLRRSPTHRVLFGILDQMVIVYRVRGCKQDAIGTEDLPL